MSLVIRMADYSQPMWKALFLSVNFYLYHLEKLAVSSQSMFSLSYGYFLLVSRLWVVFPFTRNRLIYSAF